MKLDSVFTGLNISAAGLSAQRQRMNTIAENLANAETTRTADGGPYRRKVVTFKEKAVQVFSTVMKQAGIKLETTDANHLGGDAFSMTSQQTVPAGISATESEDPAPPRLVYDPSNPDANAEGYVQMPNVNVVTEMVNMIATSRSFEANVTAITAAKTMAKDSLEI
ncbi:MAG: flagellar basal body rod protein FlgC [Bacteroidota bacterium]